LVTRIPGYCGPFSPLVEAPAAERAPGRRGRASGHLPAGRSILPPRQAVREAIAKR
jgi:hypothetical protein